MLFLKRNKKEEKIKDLYVVVAKVKRFFSEKKFGDCHIVAIEEEEWIETKSVFSEIIANENIIIDEMLRWITISLTPTALKTRKLEPKEKENRHTFKRKLDTICRQNDYICRKIRYITPTKSLIQITDLNDTVIYELRCNIKAGLAKNELDIYDYKCFDTHNKQAFEWGNELCKRLSYNYVAKTKTDETPLSSNETIVEDIKQAIKQHMYVISNVKNSKIAIPKFLREYCEELIKIYQEETRIERLIEYLISKNKIPCEYVPTQQEKELIGTYIAMAKEFISF